MIQQVRVQNFKAHRDTTVPLGRFTVLVGPNGSGKTSVLQALRAMGRLANDSLGPFHALLGELPPSSIVNRATPGGPISIALAGDADGTPWQASMEIARRITDQGEEVWRNDYSWTWGTDHFEDHQNHAGSFRATAPLPLRNVLVATELYHFDAQEIAAPAYSDIAYPYVSRTGACTSAVLAALKLDQEEAFERIEDELCRIVPNVERIRVRRSVATHIQSEMPGSILPGGVMGHEVYLDFRGAPGVPAHAASEGTLITLALLTVLHSPTRPRLLLLDDIDQSLHPQAQVQLVRELHRLLAERPDLQIVATTHSPYILDEIDTADVQVFALRGDGSVAHKRLSEHPEAAKGVLTSGQVWSLDPEKRWVVGGAMPGAAWSPAPAGSLLSSSTAAPADVSASEAHPPAQADPHVRPSGPPLA
jgi:hypothetical protein